MNRIPSGSAKFGSGRTKSNNPQKSNSIGVLRRIGIALGSVALVGSYFTIFAGTSSAVAPTPPFNECPGIGASPSCEFLIVLSSSGATVYQDSTVHVLDGSDDTLVGVINSSGAPVSNIGLSSTEHIFGFDGDGICSKTGSAFNYAWTSATLLAGCPYGTTGYEGPGVTYSNFSGADLTGTVTFTGGLADGASTFFSLEGDLASASFTVPTTTTTTTTTSTTTSTTPPPPPPTTTPSTPPPPTTTVPAPTTTVPATTTTGPATTTTAPATTTTAPPITTTSITASPPTTAPNIPPATVPSGAPGTGVGGAASSSDNGVLLTASGMVLFAGLAGLVLIARRRRHA